MFHFTQESVDVYDWGQFSERMTDRVSSFRLMSSRDWMHALVYQNLDNYGSSIFLAEWILHAWIHIERNQTWTPAWNNAIQHDETLSTKDQNSNSSSKETHHWIDALFQALNKSFKKPMWVITIASRMQVKNTSTKVVKGI
jgi:regulatory protein YycI of two-component signal transduction system YycFG